MGHKIKESNVPVGTWGNKYDSKNPVKNKLLKDFLQVIREFSNRIKNDIGNVTEFGCGEGHVTAILSEVFTKKKYWAQIILSRL